MKELIEQLVSKADINEATAEKVLKVVGDFLDDKLPSPIDTQVKKVLSGVDGDQINDVLGKAKGLFGK
jgi:nucleoid DNA-binding protein